MRTADAQRVWELGRAAVHAARLRASDADARESATDVLVDDLRGLQGLPQKLGQIFALDELTGDVQRFTPLTESRAGVETGMPSEVAFARIESELGGPLHRFFRSVSRDAMAASLGQVHRGVLLDGREVAIKVQYPDVARALETDLAAIGLLTIPFGVRARGLDASAYREELGGMARAECDYRAEAANIRRFDWLTSWPDVRIPSVVDELSTERVLTMTWVDGHSFREVRDWSLEDRARVGGSMARVLAASLFVHGVVHADPHPGNLRFSMSPDGPRLGLLDFGCVKTIAPAFGASFRELLIRLDGGDASPTRVFELFVAMGFRADLLAPLAPRLPQIAASLFAPLVSREPFFFGDWSPGKDIADLLGDDRWNFRIAGPAGALYVMRAYHGLTKYLDALDAPVDLRGIFLAADPSPATVVDWARIAADARAALAPDQKRLLVRVTDDGRMKVQVTFGAGVTEGLADLVPDEVVPLLDARGIDAAAIGRDAIERGLPRGELFALDEGARTVRVSIE
jgi:hypothetical protein